MGGFSHFPLQQAIYNKLNGDATLLGLITAVYDRPPQQSVYPYVTIGESSMHDWSTKTSTGTRQELGIHVWSRNGGRKEAAMIMDRVYTLLHHAPLTVTGQTLVLMQFASSGITLEKDAYTYQGKMTFMALLEAN